MEPDAAEFVRKRFGGEPAISVDEEEAEGEEEEEEEEEEEGGGTAAAASRSLFLFLAPLPVLSEYTQVSAILEQLPHVGCWRSHLTLRRRHEWQEYDALLRWICLCGGRRVCTPADAPADGGA